ncbi:MAG: hypothetical protein ACXABY_28340 [Candidatus Thorarchaeota archaeon]|jgi:hypothetical protein
MAINPAIADKSRWSLKAGEVAKKTCDEHEGIPIAIALAFYDPFAKCDEQYELTILMNYDPKNPPGEEERGRLEKALEFLMMGAAKIMDAAISHDEKTEGMSDYCATAKWEQ